MQCVIGGACSGRRALVASRFPEARWHRLGAGEGSWRRDLLAGKPLVITGWTAWLEAALVAMPDDEAVRTRWRTLLTDLGDAERETNGEVVLILDEVGRGIVPMAAEARRLRDQAGWLAQEAAARSRAVWYLRHGLVQRLDA